MSRQPIRTAWALSMERAHGVSGLIARSREVAQRHRAAFAPGAWVSVGPTAADIAAIDRERFAGLVNDVLIVPDGSTDRRVFIATREGGVFATDDGGDTWRPCNRGLGSLSVRSLARESVQETSSTKAALYALCGPPRENAPDELTRAGRNTNQERRAGLYKSVDGGETWFRPFVGHRSRYRAPAPPTRHQPFALAGQRVVAPLKDLVVWATDIGVLVSFDGGATWGSGAPAGDREPVPLSSRPVRPTDNDAGRAPATDLLVLTAPSDAIQRVLVAVPIFGIFRIAIDVARKSVTWELVTNRFGTVGDAGRPARQGVQVMVMARREGAAANEPVFVASTRGRETLTLWELRIPARLRPEGVVARRLGTAGIADDQIRQVDYNLALIVHPDLQVAAGRPLPDETRPMPRLASRVFLGMVSVFGADVPLDEQPGDVVTWIRVADRGDTRGFHADQHAFRHSPAANRVGRAATLWVGNDGGVHRSALFAERPLPELLGEAWQPRNKGLATLLCYVVTGSPNRDRLWLGTQDNGLWSFSAAVGWTHRQAGDGGACAIDPEHPERAWIVSTDSAVLSTNFSTPDFPELVADEDDHASIVRGLPEPAHDMGLFYNFTPAYDAGGALYIGIQTRLFRATPRVAVPQDVGDYTLAEVPLPAPTSDEQQITTLVMLPNRGGLALGTFDGRVFVGTLANPLRPAWGPALPAPAAVTDALPRRRRYRNVPVTAIRSHPTAPDKLAVSWGGYRHYLPLRTSGRVSLYTRAGGAWQRTDADGDGDPRHTLPDVPVYDLAWLPDGKLIAATEIGVYRTSDEGRTWARLGAGLPLSPCRSLVIGAPTNPSMIRVATWGSSIWELRDPPAKSALVPAEGREVFDAIPVGTEVMRGLVLRNASSAPVELTRYQIDPGVDFDLVGPPVGVTIPSGGETTIAVKFRPSKIGECRDILSLFGTGGSVLDPIMLRGVGVADPQRAELRLEPEVELFPVPITAKPKTIELMIRNVGSRAAKITAAVVYPPGVGYQRLSRDLTGDVWEPGEAARILIEAPADPDRIAVFVVHYETSGTPVADRVVATFYGATAQTDFAQGIELVGRRSIVYAGEVPVPPFTGSRKPPNPPLDADGATPASTASQAMAAPATAEEKSKFNWPAAIAIGLCAGAAGGLVAYGICKSKAGPRSK